MTKAKEVIEIYVNDEEVAWNQDIIKQDIFRLKEELEFLKILVVDKEGNCEHCMDFVEERVKCIESELEEYRKAGFT